MTDAELTKLSALAIFSPERVRVGRAGIVWIKDYFPPEVTPRTSPWAPLLDYGQALMLADQLKLALLPKSMTQQVEDWQVLHIQGFRSTHADIRRAIVTCAALVAESAKAKA